MDDSSDTKGGAEPKPAAGAVTAEMVEHFRANVDLSETVLKTYHRMLGFLFVAALAVICALLLTLFLSSSGQPSIFLVCAQAGVLGAFFSSLLRLYEYRDLPVALTSGHLNLGNLTLFIYSLVPALVGAIAAGVLYLVFAGGLLQGAFFPAFACGEGDNGCKDFSSLMSKLGPKAASDYAKVILWAFIAGFAERLVPDLLGKVAETAANPTPPKDGD